VCSTLHQPELEFAFECRLKFTRVLAVPNVLNGGFRSAVLVDEGSFEGPRLRGRCPAHNTDCQMRRAVRVQCRSEPPRIGDVHIHGDDVDHIAAGVVSVIPGPTNSPACIGDCGAHIHASNCAT
jgi:hypothetical protein